MLTEAHRRELLTVQAVAARLGLHPMTVRRKIAARQLPALQLGGKGCAIRIPADELFAWLRRPQDGSVGDRRTKLDRTRPTREPRYERMHTR